MPMHDARMFRKSAIAEGLSSICGSHYHVLDGATYPLTEYLLTPLRDYDSMPKSQKVLNLKFSPTRVVIENASKAEVSATDSR